MAHVAQCPTAACCQQENSPFPIYSVQLRGYKQNHKQHLSMGQSNQSMHSCNKIPIFKKNKKIKVIVFLALIKNQQIFYDSFML